MEEPYRPTDNILLGAELVDMFEQDGEIVLCLKKNEKTHKLSFEVTTESGTLSSRDDFGPAPSYGRMHIKLDDKYLTYGIVELEKEFNEDA